MTIAPWWRDLTRFRANARAVEYWRQRAIDQEREWARLWKEIQNVRKLARAQLPADPDREPSP